MILKKISVIILHANDTEQVCRPGRSKQSAYGLTKERLCVCVCVCEMQISITDAVNIGFVQNRKFYQHSNVLDSVN